MILNGYPICAKGYFNNNVFRQMGHFVVLNVSSLNGRWLHYSGKAETVPFGIEGLYRRIK